MRLSPARAPLNAQSLHPNSVAMMASGSSARIALSRFWLVLGLLWIVASVVWFSGQMVDRTCAARTGRARKTLRGPAVGSTRPLSKQVVPLPAEMPVLLDGDAKVHPTWQRARFGPQPRLPGRHPTPRRRRRGVTMFFFFSLPRPPEPSNAGEQDPTCNAARRAKATDGTGTENKHEIQTDKAIGAEGSNTEDLTSATDPLLQKTPDTWVKDGRTSPSHWARQRQPG